MQNTCAGQSMTNYAEAAAVIYSVISQTLDQMEQIQDKVSEDYVTKSSNIEQLIAGMISMTSEMLQNSARIHRALSEVRKDNFRCILMLSRADLFDCSSIRRPKSLRHSLQQPQHIFKPQRQLSIPRLPEFNLRSPPPNPAGVLDILSLLVRSPYRPGKVSGPTTAPISMLRSLKRPFHPFYESWKPSKSSMAAAK